MNNCQTVLQLFQKFFNNITMELIFSQKNLSKKEEESFVNYLDQKKTPIGNLLSKFADDASILKVSIEKFEKHDAFSVEFVLNLPTKSLKSEEASHTIQKAVDLAKDRLVAQIKKHLAMLRRDRSHKSIKDHEEALVPENVEIF